MKIVKFDNGNYGIRMHWFFGWRFYNFGVKHTTCAVGDPYFHQAQMYDKDIVIREYNKLTGKSAKYKVVEPNE